MSLTSALQASTEHDVEIIEPSREMLASIESFGPKIIDGAIDLAKDEHNVSNPEALIEEVVAIFDKWEGLLANADRSDQKAIIKLIQENLYNNIDASSYAID